MDCDHNYVVKVSSIAQSSLHFAKEEQADYVNIFCQDEPPDCDHYILTPVAHLMDKPPSEHLDGELCNDVLSLDEPLCNDDTKEPLTDDAFFAGNSSLLGCMPSSLSADLASAGGYYLASASSQEFLCAKSEEVSISSPVVDEMSNLGEVEDVKHDPQPITLLDGNSYLLPANLNVGELHPLHMPDGSIAYIATSADDDSGTSGANFSQPDSIGAKLSEKAFKCAYEGCGKYYTTLHHLKVHLLAHTGDRPYKCDFDSCEKGFATSYGLKSHRRVHTGEKPYWCKMGLCNKAFKTSGDLQKHLRIHTGEKPFTCPIDGCNRQFTTSNICKVHVRTHTGEKPYTCGVGNCNKSFASATNYKNHLRIHSGEKPYVCPVENCGKRFTEYSSLYKHNIVHTASRPYACECCGKRYRQTSTLAMHRRTAHGQAEFLTSGDGVEGGPIFLSISLGKVSDSSMLQHVQMNDVHVKRTTTCAVTSSATMSSIPIRSSSMAVSKAAVGSKAAQTAMLTLPAPNSGGQLFLVTDPVQLELLHKMINQNQRAT